MVVVNYIFSFSFKKREFVKYGWLIFERHSDLGLKSKLLCLFLVE